MPPRPRDETDNRYGRITVLRWITGTQWLCLCDCGTERVFYIDNLRSGATQSCGCHRQEQSKAWALQRVPDEVGNRYGKLLVTERAGTRGRTAYWLCRCDCERVVTVRASRLRNGSVLSCGCWAPVRKRKNQTGELHHRWKGEDVSYHALHVWLRNNKTKTGRCSKCDAERYTEWGNVSKDRKRSRNLDDYIEICKPCHMEMDGHPWVGHK